MNRLLIKENLYCGRISIKNSLYYNMISEKNKFIFIHIPGTAGTSIEYAISEASDGKLVQQGAGVWFHPKYSDAVN